MPFEFPKHPLSDRRDPFKDPEGRNPYADEAPATPVSENPYATSVDSSGVSYQPGQHQVSYAHRGPLVFWYGLAGLATSLAGAAGVATATVGARGGAASAALPLSGGLALLACRALLVRLVDERPRFAPCRRARCTLKAGRKPAAATGWPVSDC